MFLPLVRIVLCGFLIASSLISHAQSERIVIDGSTGVTPLVEALAKAYRAANPGVDIEIGKGMGTKARIVALNEGRIDIAMASHGLDVPGLRGQGMVIREIGKVAVVFGVNASVPLSDLSSSQLCDIYAGRLRNWKEAAGPDMPIIPIARPESEVDTEVVRDRISCFKGLRLADDVRIAPKAPDMANELAATRGAIGMTTTTIVQQSETRIRAVSIAGVAPTPDNVQNKRYVLTRDSFLVTRGSASPAVSKFLEFIRSPGGENVIVANGAVPVK